ncbi:MAG: response regulator [Desulfuromonadales bacterium]|nr:response regulator [Desulfuromonadales bacterium]
MSVIDQVFGFFLEEAQDHLGILESGLLALENDPAVVSTWIDQMFRAAHSLKGSANLVKVTDVGSIAHCMEDLLEKVRDGNLELNRPHIDAMLFALDSMQEIINRRKDKLDLPPDLVSTTLSRLAAADIAEPPAPTTGPDHHSKLEEPIPAADRRAEGESYWGIERREWPRRGEKDGVVRVGMDKIDALVDLVGEFTVTKNHLMNRVPVLEALHNEISLAGQRLIKEVTEFSERYDYTMPTSGNTVAAAGFTELEFDRYDDLNLFSRKMREITNDMEEALREMTAFFAVFSRDVGSLHRNNEDMKERISAARTIAVSELFQRFNRTIRDLAEEVGKPVDLFISGGETPIDRVIFDRLFDPVLHIVRNSFAHGIEPVKERLAQGKPERAQIWMKAERRGNTVDISVEDDGRGINIAGIRARAIDKGIISAGDKLSDQQLVQLIFRPGFSTATVTDKVSGRGVGMNVVMDRLAGLNGTIDVWTEAGKGTRFQMRLPLSLVIVNVVRFDCGQQTMVIPTALVDEIVDLAGPTGKDDSHDRCQRIDLANLLQLQLDTAAPPGLGIVTQSEGAPVMLLVDAIHGQEDTVIKPFGSFLEELVYFSGTSLAGDGSMRLVVNPARMRHPDLRIAGVSLAPTISTPVVPKVLIVDDSLSVRKYASMILNNHGYQVLTAVNGEDALDKLDTEDIFSIITDLEMPLMHGYDLLREIRRRGLNIPVAVLTSRAGEQHRKEAIQLGATDYLVKPFDEEDLLDVIRKHKKL